MCRHRNRILRQWHLLNPHRYHRHRHRRSILQRSRSSLMHASSRVEMTDGKTCLNAHFCSGHRQWSKSAAIVLVERYCPAVATTTTTCLSVLCHVLTVFLSLICFGLYIPPYFFSLLDTTRRISLVSVLSGRNDASFSYAVCYYLFPPKLSHTLSPHTLSVVFLSFLLFPLRHRYYPVHQITVCNVYTLFDSIQTRSLCYFLINASFLSIPSNGNTGPMLLIHWQLCRGPTRTRACSAFSLRQPSLPLGSHAKHTSTPVSVPSPSAVFLTS